MNANAQPRVAVAVFKPALLDALETLPFQPASMIGTCIVSSTVGQALDARALTTVHGFRVPPISCAQTVCKYF